MKLPSVRPCSVFRVRSFVPRWNVKTKVAFARSFIIPSPHICMTTYAHTHMYVPRHATPRNAMRAVARPRGGSRTKLPSPAAASAHFSSIGFAASLLWLALLLPASLRLPPLQECGGNCAHHHQFHHRQSVHVHTFVPPSGCVHNLFPQNRILNQLWGTKKLAQNV